MVLVRILPNPEHRSKRREASSGYAAADETLFAKEMYGCPLPMALARSPSS